MLQSIASCYAHTLPFPPTNTNHPDLCARKLLAISASFLPSGVPKNPRVRSAQSMNAVPVLLPSVYFKLNTLRKLSAASGSDPTSSSPDLSISMSSFPHQCASTTHMLARCSNGCQSTSISSVAAITSFFISSWIHTPP